MSEHARAQAAAQLKATLTAALQALGMSSLLLDHEDHDDAFFRDWSNDQLKVCITLVEPA